MGTQLPSLKKAQPPIFCPCPLWSNGCIDYDATWYGGLVPSDTVRWRPYCPQRGHSTPNFRPMPIVGKRLDGSRCHLVWRQASVQATLCYMGTQLRPYGKEHSSPNVYACCAGLVSYAPLLITQLTIVCLLHGRRQACVRKPRPMCIVAKGPPSQLLLSTCKFVTNLRIG